MYTSESTPLIASLIDSEKQFVSNKSQIEALASIAPELYDWMVVGIDGNRLNLIQFFPGLSIGRKTPAAQASAMSIIGKLTPSRAEIRADGSIETWLQDGTRILLHDAIAPIAISVPATAAA